MRDRQGAECVSTGIKVRIPVGLIIFSFYNWIFWGFDRSSDCHSKLIYFSLLARQDGEGHDQDAAADTVRSRPRRG